MMVKIIAQNLLLLGLASTATSVEYGVGPLNDSDTVYFKSSAKLEFVQGKAQNINGSFSFDPGNSSGGATGIIRVDLRTLKTGINKRDEHMRDNHLHTAKFPYVYFELESVNPVPTLATYDSAYTTKAKGNFYIHGIYREIEVELELIRNKIPAGGEIISVKAKFSINLDDYEIPRPKALFLKLAKTIEVEAHFTGYSNAASPKIELPDWRKQD